MPCTQIQQEFVPDSWRCRSRSVIQTREAHTDILSWPGYQRWHRGGFQPQIFLPPAALCCSFVCPLADTWNRAEQPHAPALDLTVLLQKAVPVHRNTTWTPDEEFNFIRAAQAHLIQTAMSLLPAFLHYFFFPESFCSTLHQGGKKKKRFLSSRVNSHTLQWDECNVLNNKSWKGELFSAPFRWKWSLASILPPTWSHGMIL